jgi:hypothetical protein
LFVAVLLAAACRISDQTAPTGDLSQILIRPDSASIAAGQSVQFAAVGRTPSGQERPVSVKWSATGGTIDATGLYASDTTPGAFEVTATLEQPHLTASARVKNHGPLKQVVLTPPTDTIAPGGQLQFTASGVTASKDTVLVSVVYTATGGTISSTGVYAAGSTPGAYRVIATQSGGSIADTSAVTISGTAPPAVVSVAVSPTSASVAVGSSQQLQVTVKDATGAVLTGRTVTWTSSNTAAATVNASGLVLGIATGAATITATCEGKSASAAITVSGSAPPGTHAGYYVMPPPYGTSTGDGTSSRPWDLATAFAGGHGNTIQPGDTVWLRGGTYQGSFQTSLAGSAQAPIVFRQYPGERATIDGTLSAQGSYLWFWGFEIMQSTPQTVRVLAANTVNGKFINLVLHDAGISGASMAADKGAGVELYGSIAYNNGTHENLDHGLYGHNATSGTKYVTDNVFFANYARGIQIYEDGVSLIRNFQVIGNISFNNGTISDSSNRTNLLISAPATTSGMVARDNLLYFTPGVDGTQLRLGNYDSSNTALYNRDIDVENNYAAGGTLGLGMQFQWAQATVKGNVFVGDGSTSVVRTGGSAVDTYLWAGNTYYRDPAASAWRQNTTNYDFSGWKSATRLGGSDQVFATGPSTATVFVRPNRYEPGRAFIVVYNFARLGAVNVDVSPVLSVGAQYEVRNVQDVFGAPVISGSYGGGAITIPMNGVQPPAPIGRATPRQAPKTGPAFDVFLLTSKAP